MPQSQETDAVGTPTDTKTEVKTAETTPQEAAKAEPKTSAEAVVEALGISDAEVKKKEPEPKSEDTDAAPTEGEKAEEPETKSPKKSEATPDEIEIPKDITNPKSQERFRVLATQVKEKDQQLAKINTEYQAVRKDVDDFRELIQDSTNSTQEFAQLLDYSKAVKTGNYEHALKMLDAQRAALARVAGLKVDGVDVFADHPDLKQRVDALELDEASALELVRRRSQDQATQQRARAEQAQRSNAQQAEAAVQAATAQITDIAKQWQGSDIDYRAKHPQLMARAKEIAAEYPPQLWAKALTDYYKTLSVPKTETKQTPAPLRPTGGSGGHKTPKTSLEAVAASLGIAQ